MSEFVCPHCGGVSKVIPQKKRGFKRSHTFESVAPAIPPAGKLSSLLWFLRGNVAVSEVPPSQPVVVKVETWDYAKNEVRFQDMDERITWPVVCELAAMVNAGLDWTRENITRHTSLSENAVRVYQSDFKRLGYLEVSANNRSILTSAGRRFLRGVLAMSKGQKSGTQPTHNNTQR